MPGLSPAYREYMNGPRWREAKARHWARRWTVKSCVVCGARRGEKALDMHHLRYKTRGGVMQDPGRFELVPACARPCHRWLITPLSRHRWARWIILAVLFAGLVWLGAPPLWTAAAVGLLLALPRIPETTMLLFLLGLPVRTVRACVRWGSR